MRVKQLNEQYKIMKNIKILLLMLVTVFVSAQDLDPEFLENFQMILGKTFKKIIKEKLMEPLKHISPIYTRQN